MKYIFLIIAVFLAKSLFAANDIFKSKIKGIEIQAHDFGDGDVCKFTVSESGDTGILVAWDNDGESAKIFRTTLKGTAIDSFNPGIANHIYKFTTSDPDGEGWITITAHSRPGKGSGPIIKTKLKGTLGFDLVDVGAGNSIHGFTATPAGEFMVLGIIIKPLAVELVSFDASGQDGYVAVEWETASEIDLLGYNLQRSMERDFAYTQINTGFIYGEGSAVDGADYFYIDTSVTNGLTYWYRLEALDMDGGVRFYGPDSATPGEKQEMRDERLEMRVYPNPATAGVRIQWSGIKDSGQGSVVSEGQEISLKIYDLTGRLVRTLIPNPLPLTTAVEWDGKDEQGRQVKSNIYFLRLKAGDVRLIRKFVLIR